MSPGTQRVYDSARKRLEKWLDGRALDDAAMAEHLRWLQDSGYAYSTATQAVSAVRRHVRAGGRPDPTGELTGAALKRFRRVAPDRGWGQAQGLTVADVNAILDTVHRRRRYPGSGRTESAARAARRGPEDAAIVSVLFQGGLRRSEAAALRWRDVFKGREGGVLIRVRRSKTNPDGRPDLRFLKDRCAEAVLRLRAERGGAERPRERVFGGLRGESIAKRLRAAARAAGIEGRITGHSGRVGLAAELTARGAPLQAVMLAGNWKSPTMVAHYSAAARAERGAVAKYL